MTSKHSGLLRLVVTLVVLGAGATARSGAAQGPDHRVVIVNVLDARGNPVSGLTAANFSGECHGQPVRIVNVSEDTAPRHVALVIDVRGSQMESIGREWVQAQQLIEALVPRASISVYTLNNKLKRYCELTTDRDTLERAIRDARVYRAAGDSALYDGVAQVADAMADSHSRNAICLLSDGDDDISRHSRADVARTLVENNMPVFVIGDFEPRFSFQPARVAWGTIADDTGGTAMWLYTLGPNPDEEAGSTSRIATAITSGYRIELDLARPLEEAGHWTLHVTDSNGRALKDVRVLYPHALLPVPH